MTRLSDLVNVNINKDTISIQGVPIPVIFSLESFLYVEEVYGKDYGKFEAELNTILAEGKVELNTRAIFLINVLLYAMVRSGGTECEFEEIKTSIPVGDLQEVFQVALNIFNRQIFQKSDMEKIKTEKKS